MVRKGCRWLTPNKNLAGRTYDEDLGITIYGCKLNCGNLSIVYANVHCLQRAQTELKLKCLLFVGHVSPEGPCGQGWSPPRPWTTGTVTSCHLVRAWLVTSGQASRGTTRGLTLHRPKAVGATHDGLTPPTEIPGKPVVPKLKRDLVTER